MSKTFIDGELLTAADVNQHLVNPDPIAKMQANTDITVPSGSGGVNVKVTFPTAFATVPAVILTVSHPNLEGARVINKSSSGFTARFDRAGASTYTFDWIAMVP
ncbi:hypothetical protein [Mycolicibacterium sp.]|uniref:hypothetical protein n=1 Tax=Mycolicibacterium sp. TaxID=2320850 RepID=UPI00355E0D54